MLRSLKRYTLLIIYVAMFAVMAVFIPQFLAVDNVVSILRHTSFAGILAIALTLVVIAGEFDISFAAIASFAGIATALMMPGIPLPVAWLIGLGIGIGIGAFNAFNVSILGMPSFIATLGTMIVLDGISHHVTNGAYVVNFDWPANFGFMGQNMVFGILPNPVVFLLIIFVVFVILTWYSGWGRRLYAVGGNPEASKHVGINAIRMKFTAFILAGVLSAFAGLLTASQLSCVEPLMDDAYQMPAISAMFLGSVFIKEGIPNIWGTVLAALLMVTLVNGLGLVGSSQWVKILIQGAILLTAVGIVAGLKKGVIPTLKI